MGASRDEYSFCFGLTGACSLPQKEKGKSLAWPLRSYLSLPLCPGLSRDTVPCFSRELPVPPGLRDAAYSQWLDQHFHFPENHNLPPTSSHHNLSSAARSVWRAPGLSAQLGPHPWSCLTRGCLCPLLFRTFKHSQDLEATQVSTDHGWIKMLRFTYTTEYSSAIKKNETLSLAATEMGLESIILSEISQKQMPCNFTYIGI